jgi:hypothetical protein
MRMPGFTAEASLTKTDQRYILSPEAPAETGGVLPQFHIRPIPPHCGCYHLPGGGMVCTCI